MDIASTNDDGETPLLSSCNDQAGEGPNEKSPTPSDSEAQHHYEPRDDEAHSEPHPIGGGVSALTLAMVIFYNVTGKSVERSSGITHM